MNASFPFTSSSNHLIIQHDAFPLYLKYCGSLVKNIYTGFLNFSLPLFVSTKKQSLVYEVVNVLPSSWSWSKGVIRAQRPLSEFMPSTHTLNVPQGEGRVSSFYWGAIWLWGRGFTCENFGDVFGCVPRPPPLQHTSGVSSHYCCPVSGGRALVSLPCHSRAQIGSSNGSRLRSTDARMKYKTLVCPLISASWAPRTALRASRVLVYRPYNHSVHTFYGSWNWGTKMAYNFPGSHSYCKVKPALNPPPDSIPRARNLLYLHSVCLLLCTRAHLSSGRGDVHSP